MTDIGGSVRAQDVLTLRAGIDSSGVGIYVQLIEVDGGCKHERDDAAQTSSPKIAPNSKLAVRSPLPPNVHHVRSHSPQRGHTH